MIKRSSIARLTVAAADGSLQPSLEWITRHVVRDPELAELATAANLSTRKPARRLRAQTGATPITWLTRRCVDAARELMETTDTPVEQVGALVSLPAAIAFRERFCTLTGITPSAYRAAIDTSHSRRRRRAAPPSVRVDSASHAAEFDDCCHVFLASASAALAVGAPSSG